MLKRFFSLPIILVFAGSLYADLAVTIYNQDLALVRETRQVEFPKGVGEIRFVDVAARIIPTSVHFASKQASLLEQNYEYDLVSADKLLQKYIDQRVDLTAQDDKQFTGVLLSSAGDIVIRELDGSIRSLNRAQVVNVHFPDLPAGLITRPTLVWLVNGKGSQGAAEISYLTNGMSWEAEYVAVTDADDKALSLTGWVNIANNSGAAYKEAKIKLMAGDVNILQDEGRGRYGIRAERMMAMADAGVEPQFKEEAFYEYHLYTLQRPSTLGNNQVKQISLFPTADVKSVKKEYRFAPSGYDWRQEKDKIKVTLEFENKEANELGIPLPKGKVRVYKASKDGGMEFIGEDRIDHTAREEKVRISTGNAFDIVGERKQTDAKRGGAEYAVEIKLRNRKKETVEVIVAENIWGDWTMLEATPGWEKKSANLIEWKVPVKPDEEKALTYRVLINR